MNIRPFGYMKNGSAVDAITLRHNNCAVTVLSMGGTVQSFLVDNRDIVCGFDSPEGYETCSSYMGALIGRYANRLKDGKFTLNEKEYQLAKNENGITHSHGGNIGWDKRIWKYAVFGNEKGEGVKLFLQSKDGEEGYPGTLDVKVTYFLSDLGLSVHYQATGTEDTVLNMTNHAYFNVDGYTSGSILSHTLQISADTFTPVDEHSIPLERAVSVEGNGFDFRTPKAVGDCDGAFMNQYANTRGLDHNFNLTASDDCTYEGHSLTKAAVLTGNIGKLTLYTDFPCLQVYAGNYMEEAYNMKGNVSQVRNTAICLEAQTCGANGPSRGEGILRGGEHYDRFALFKAETLS